MPTQDRCAAPLYIYSSVLYIFGCELSTKISLQLAQLEPDAWSWYVLLKDSGEPFNDWTVIFTLLCVVYWCIVPSEAKGKKFIFDKLEKFL